MWRNEAVRQLFTEPAAFAKDVVVDTALEKGLDMGRMLA